MGFFKFARDNASFLAAGALMAFMSSFGQTFFISIFSGEIRESFGISHGGWGGLYMLGTAASAAVMIWAGALTDRYRVRVLGPVILIALAGACLFMATNTWLWALPVSVFLLRLLGQGMCSQIAAVAMSRWFVASRGKALSISALGFSLGEATLPLMFVALMGWVDWRLLWVAAACVCLLGIAVLWPLLGQERTPQSLAHQDKSTGMEGRHWTRAQALRHPLFWMMVPAILGPSAFNTAFFFHQVHFAEIKGLDHVQLVSLFPLYTALSITAMVSFGWALDRFGAGRLAPFHQIPIGLGFVAFSYASAPGGIALGLGLVALTSGAMATVINAFWAEFYGTAHIGAIKAAAAAVMVLGSAIGPGLTGALIDLGIAWDTQFQGIAAFFVLTTILMWLGIQSARRHLSQN